MRRADGQHSRRRTGDAPQSVEIVEGLVKRKKYICLCTKAILLEEKLKDFKPSTYLTFSIHMDGPKKEHDIAVCKDGVYDVAVSAIKADVKAGFRVTTNTTLLALPLLISR